MDIHTTDHRRTRIAMVGMIAGAVLACVSAALNVRLPSGTMREDFDTMAAHAWSILAQDLLETAGFTLVLAGLSCVALLMVRGRGAALGMAGSVLAVVGIVGFAMSNATGMGVVALSLMPDRDASFDVAMAVTSSGPSAVLGGLGFLLEVAGQLGIVLVLGSMVRARLLSRWALAPVAAGIVVNAIGGSMMTTALADLLLVVAMGWTARALLRDTVAEHASEPVPAGR